MPHATGNGGVNQDEEIKARIAAKAEAARSVIHKAGLAIEELTEVEWRVSRFASPTTSAEKSTSPGLAALFWPATGFWRWEDGHGHGYGAEVMVAVLRGAKPHKHH
jgi:hypothetical protein